MEEQKQSKFKKLNFSDLKEKALSTKGLIIGGVCIFVLFGVFLIVDTLKPRKGSMIYGICNTFLEQQITFPHTLQYTAIEQYSKAVRIYFTHTDAFGQYQFEFTECTFRQDPQKGVQLDRVFFNYAKEITADRRLIGKGRLYEVKKEVIDLFNQSNSAAAIMSQNPDLSLPKYRGFRF